MKVPNADRAYADPHKIADYLLNPEHERGKHKARVFASVLGIERSDAEALRHILVQIVKTEEAVPGEADEYGQRYVIDFVLYWHEREALTRSTWIIRTGEDFPRLTSCYVL
ncbi:MAG: hypothetical protein JNL42_09960 [Anaerolineae bacterium]|nr:hypothetical protein [Anaerolineae bacterium]